MHSLFLNYEPFLIHTDTLSNPRQSPLSSSLAVFTGTDRSHEIIGVLFAPIIVMFFLFFLNLCCCFQLVECFLFCCVTVDAINDTMAALYNDTDLFSGEFWHPLVFNP